MPLHLVGPTGFADRVEHKLMAYTLNLLDEHPFDFFITAAEFVEERVERVCEFRAREAFRRRELSPVPLPSGTLLDEDQFQIKSVVLDHGTPCLAFAFEEKLRVNVWSEGLKSLQLGVGPWLKEAKRAVRRGAPDDSEVVISPDQPERSGAGLPCIRRREIAISRTCSIAGVNHHRHDGGRRKANRLGS
jgi:ribonuclease Z